MIVVDTNVLVGLVNPRDEHHRAASGDLQRLRNRPMFLTEPVLVEAVFLLPARPQRRLLAALVDEIPLRELRDPRDLRRDVFDWLDRYAEHNPDYADAHLSVLSGLRRTVRIWTYDAEFVNVWRRPDGSPVPLATRR
jgi:predicted nucleic acid-binding protein